MFRRLARSQHGTAGLRSGLNLGPEPFPENVLSILTTITIAHRQAIGADDLAEVIVENNPFHETLFDQCGNRHITGSIRQHAGLSHTILQPATQLCKLAKAIFTDI